MKIPVTDDQGKFSPISSVQTLDAVTRTYQEQWPIAMDGDGESRESLPSARINIGTQLYDIKYS